MCYISVPCDSSVSSHSLHVLVDPDMEFGLFKFKFSFTINSGAGLSRGIVWLLYSGIGKC